MQVYVWMVYQLFNISLSLWDTVSDVLEPSAGGNTMPLHPKHQQQQDTALATFEQIDFAQRATILHETLLFFLPRSCNQSVQKKGIDHQ